MRATRSCQLPPGDSERGPLEGGRARLPAGGGEALRLALRVEVRVQHGATKGSKSIFSVSRASFFLTLTRARRKITFVTGTIGQL